MGPSASSQTRTSLPQPSLSSTGCAPTATFENPAAETAPTVKAVKGGDYHSGMSSSGTRTGASTDRQAGKATTRPTTTGDDLLGEEVLRFIRLSGWIYPYEPQQEDIDTFKLGDETVSPRQGNRTQHSTNEPDPCDPQLATNEPDPCDPQLTCNSPLINPPALCRAVVPNLSFAKVTSQHGDADQTEARDSNDGHDGERRTAESGDRQDNKDRQSVASTTTGKDTIGTSDIGTFELGDTTILGRYIRATTLPSQFQQPAR
ncbi:hypothetical protein THAOC_37519 [Thalassiosira oceanica]|uniref:Uncharacterized protein n=1 Tax=Thalassiosira oceanica TaxID=159749 RepID=K0QYP9_THAOC|nr:hypothetical protein THAOC_37519 [Thalassiosira oceanica]|eukprot:EJK43985.1 hypothetical protein THAOC_37519 [Thalassiosira oceanica]